MFQSVRGVVASPARSLVMLVVALSLSACAGTHTPEPPKPVIGGMQFTVVIPGARSVAVAGSFNGWSLTAHPLKLVGSNGVWSGVIPVPAGEHTFMYVVDGTKWVIPPLAEDFVTDGFGSTNGVVVVR